MQAGNARYLKPEDLPDTIPIFPLSGALLLPSGQLPLNIFEPRYLMMFDDALAHHRIIGMVQPSYSEQMHAELCPLGCLGRITSIAETGDGRYVTALTGICRYRLMEEVHSSKPYRSFRIAPFLTDLTAEEDDEAIDRPALLAAFRAYLDANRLEADWDSVERAGNRTLVNSMSMMSPFGPAEKQALLEAPDLRSRAETLIAITEFAIAGDGSDTVLQ